MLRVWAGLNGCRMMMRLPGTVGALRYPREATMQIPNKTITQTQQSPIRRSAPPRLNPSLRPLRDDSPHHDERKGNPRDSIK